jgi:exopolyphosphatase / guanosine-5'-triphosphate,3'-diphosphate pyrophosphatase
VTAAPTLWPESPASAMSPIPTESVVPRWEWRVFERTFAAIAPDEHPGTPPTEQTYMLSLLSPHSVKVRDGLLEIKRLERVGERGLQLWRPVLRAAFPIGPEDLSTACAAWGIPAVSMRRPRYTLSDLLDSVVVPHPQLRIVTLTKRRLPISIGPCEGERAQITIGRHRWNTVSVEGPDRPVVLETLRELGLDPGANEDYPRALKRILGLPDHSSDPRALTVL